MGMVMIKCPSTGQAVPTGIEIEEATFTDLPNVGSGMACPACGGHHIWRKADAWLNDDSVAAPDRPGR
jgi:predicted RNA-binding Zn-ribbon protein involved in translation (DUF1610 family)